MRKPFVNNQLRSRKQKAEKSGRQAGGRACPPDCRPGWAGPGRAEPVHGVAGGRACVRALATGNRRTRAPRPCPARVHRGSRGMLWYAMPESARNAGQRLGCCQGALARAYRQCCPLLLSSRLLPPPRLAARERNDYAVGRRDGCGCPRVGGREGGGRRETKARKSDGPTGR